MRRSLLTIAVLALVLGAGCLGFGGQPQRSDRAEATLADAQSALEDIDTYHYETEMHLSATAEGETIDRDVEIAGTVDLTERMAISRLHMEGENYTAYVNDGSVYRECRGPWGWGNESLGAEGDWVRATPLGGQLNLLESGDLRLETGNSVPADAVVLVGHPAPEELEDVDVRGSGSVFGGPSVKNLTVRVVIDNRTRRPIRSTISFEMSGGGGVGEGTVDTTYAAYDEPVSIEIPDEVVEEAGEMSCPGS